MQTEYGRSYAYKRGIGEGAKKTNLHLGRGFKMFLYCAVNVQMVPRITKIPSENKR